MVILDAQTVIVIPTYRPGPDLIQLIDSLGTANLVVIADDASPCTFDSLLGSLEERTRLSVIRNTRRRGIARGLNQGLEVARRTRARWLLTLDQDSCIQTDFLDRLLAAAVWISRVNPSVKALAPGRVTLERGSLSYGNFDGRAFEIVPEVLQSGAIWCVETLCQIGGFDQALGMDAVDAEMCLRLSEHGFTVAVDPKIHMHHRLGSARPYRILGKSLLVTGHSPDRQRSMLRNRLRLAPREFARSPVHALRTIRRVSVNALLSRASEIAQGKWSTAAEPPPSYRE